MVEPADSPDSAHLGSERVDIPIEDLARINNEMMNLNRELQRDRAALTRQERFVSKLVATVPAYIYVCELPAMRATFINDAVAQLAGVEPDQAIEPELLRRTNLTPRGPDGRQLGATVLAGLPDEGLVEWEVDLTDVAGKTLWVQARATALDRDASGRVTSLLVIGVDTTARREAESELQRVATTDRLTGLLNRSGLDLRAQVLLDRSRRNGSPVGVAFFDLDRLKETNDTLGHTAGDSLLKAASAAILGNVRASDVVARIGGDEFVVVVGDATEAGMANLVDRVRVLAGELEGAAIDDGKLTPLLSAGWIVRTPSAEDTLAQLIDRADAEMYVDKSARQARRQK